MLVPEQRQGNWRGFVVLTVINHSPELNCLTRTFLAALLLSHPEKQMVALLPCVCRNASQITQGVFSDVCVCGKVRLAQLSNFTRIGRNSDYTFHGRGKEFCYLLLFGKCKRVRGTQASAVIPSFGCTSKNIASAEVLKGMTCFSTSFGYKFLWNGSSLAFNELRSLEVFCTQAWYSPEVQLFFAMHFPWAN